MYSEIGGEKKKAEKGKFRGVFGVAIDHLNLLRIEVIECVKLFILVKKYCTSLEREEARLFEGK